MRAAKSILFIAPQPFFEWRGTPIRVKFNIMALVAAGYRVDLLTLPIGQDEPISGVNVYRVANPFCVKKVPIGPSLWKVFFDVLLACKGVRLCWQMRYNVIHGVEEAGLIAVCLAKLFRVGAIFEKHSDPSSYKAGFFKNLILRAYAACERLSTRLADAVIGTGPGLVEQVQAMGTRTRAFHIPDLPSSLEDPSSGELDTTRQTLSVSPQEVLVTYVGSFAIYQGVDLLFEAIPLVVRESPQVRFMIIGGTPMEIEARRHVLQAKDVGDAVLFVGTIDPGRLPAYLAASDILLSTRKSGINTPLKILDYLKAGRAIVATDVPANRLLLNDALALFAEPQADVFAQTIRRLAADEALRRGLGEAGRACYAERFTFGHHQKRLADCYAYVEQLRASDVEETT